MDTAEHDSDVKLYKASAELLAELQAKLPLLLVKPDGSIRKCVLTAKKHEVAKLIDTFQEWPQLLDPILSSLVQRLVDPFLSYCVSRRNSYRECVVAAQPHIEPLPRAVCYLLYMLCKVRGYKVIVRLLNNEPKYIEPLLLSFHAWRTFKGDGATAFSWQESYVMLLWLSHLMLAPFELSSISSTISDSVVVPQMLTDLSLPELATDLLILALDYVFIPSKDREAASLLILRLAWRKDMQVLRLPGTIIQWCCTQLSSEGQGPADQYEVIGHLMLLFGLINSAAHKDVAPFVQKVFSTAHTLASEDTPRAEEVKRVAPARKLLIKTMRTATQHALALSNQSDDHAIETDTMLEDIIQILLEMLADTDTPVRQAASKALSTITLALESDMAAEVIEAVLGCLEENMLLENRSTGEIIAVTDVSSSDDMNYRKNVNAVDPLKWHGAMLTLGHVLFRRAPPVSQLPEIVRTLLIGIRFEQRSSVGTSLGVGVRDAACFGMWSLARKYTTSELATVFLTPDLSPGMSKLEHGHQSVLQIVATELVVAACLDPSGNMRRGSSAALQELIGRHPDVVMSGIPLVQAVDYHAVARRSRSLNEVAAQAARLGPMYHGCLLFALLEWRGIRATDAESRRQSARSISSLLIAATPEVQEVFSQEVLSQLRNLKPTNAGASAAARHGLFFTLAEFILASRSQSSSGRSIQKIWAPLMDMGILVGDIDGRVTPDILLVLEACATLLTAVLTNLSYLDPGENWVEWPQTIMPLVQRCLSATDDDLVCQPTSKAVLALFAALGEHDRSRLVADLVQTGHSLTTLGNSRGLFLSLGLLLPSKSSAGNHARNIAQLFHFVINTSASVDVKVSAMEGITSALQEAPKVQEECLALLQEAIVVGLSDYTIDQRGDIGSKLRSVSVNAAHAMQALKLSPHMQRPILERMVKLAVERMTKLRFEAWCYLENIWSLHFPQVALKMSFQHQADCSSPLYFQQLIQLTQIEWLQRPIVMGLISSITGSTDEIARAAADALVAHLTSMNESERQNFLDMVVQYLCQHFTEVIADETKDPLPAIDTLTFLVEQYRSCVSITSATSLENTILLANKSANITSAMPRIEALIRLGSALATIPQARGSALDLLTRKLLHKYPRIRGAAADGIFDSCSIDAVLRIDWNLPAVRNKSVVVDIRKQLGVAGNAA